MNISQHRKVSGLELEGLHCNDNTLSLLSLPLSVFRHSIPIVFRWDSGGNEVYICGSFNKWETKIPMTNRYTYIHAHMHLSCMYRTRSVISDTVIVVNCECLLPI